MKVFLMRGLPGSGKSTWLGRMLGHNTRLLRFSADDFFTDDEGQYRFDPAKLPEAHNDCLRRFLAVQRLAPREFIGVDNTNVRVHEIAPYHRFAEAFGWEVEIIWHIRPLDVCLSRNTHNVPEATLRAMLMSFEPLPTWWNQRIVTEDLKS